ncbi:serine/threonine-protein kinase Nek6-like [Capsicum annuum]|uniref:serine/threonine-protein kinase Nek6-like n=1 Tax=Capsicum annuum TaxID=4072 RepID=UPI001FB0EB91|nr:serine/threonine-protein kinase Nek6-like [Capsicum annuum]
MLRKTPEHQPTAAELLRHQHLQPYLPLCHNPSSAFLPVKSPSRTKEKTRPSPGKSISPRGSRDRQLKLKEKRTVLYFDESDNIQPRNLSDNYNTFQAKLDTKRVDPTSYSVRIFQDSEDSKSGEMSEAAVCNGYDQQETIS